MSDHKSRLKDSVLIEYRPFNSTQGQPIARIATHLYFIHKHQHIANLINAFTDNKTLEAVGVVDASGKAIGIVIQKDLLALMSRPYARQIFDKKSVADISAEARSFISERNIFSVADEIAEELKAPKITYFLLTDQNGEFQGIFSSKDMLIYLSELTKRDISMAQQLQKRIVKERDYFDTINFEISASANPAKGVGGDFYAVKNYNNTNWIIALCDVSGKGVAASIITSVIWGMMSIFDFNVGLKHFIIELNNYLVNTFGTEKFVTALFIEFNETTGSVRLCDLGHSYLYTFRENSLIKLKTNSNNMPLGILPDVNPDFCHFTMRKDDILFLLTDGLVEQVNTDKQPYSLTRVEEIIREHNDKRLSTIRDELLADFHQFRSLAHLQDDITFLFLRYLGKQESET